MERMIAIYLYSSSSVVRENFKPFRPLGSYQLLIQRLKEKGRLLSKKAIFYDMLPLTSAKHAEDLIESFDNIPKNGVTPSKLKKLEHMLYLIHSAGGKRLRLSKKKGLYPSARAIQLIYREL